MAPPQSSPRIAPVSTPATGWRLRLNQAVLGALHVLPGPVRRQLGWWRWKEVLEGSTYKKALDRHKRNPEKLPVSRLYRRGFVPQESLTPPAPPIFRRFHSPWNWDNYWNTLPDSELTAWVGMWRSHPHGQECLDHALVGVALQGDPDRVRLLMGAGANPDPKGESGQGSLMGRLWGSPDPFDTVLAVWKEVCNNKVAVPSWGEWSKTQDGSPWVRRRTAEQMERWRQSGLPYPTGQAALLHALAWVKDPPIHASHDEGSEAAFAALGWFKEHGDLPSHARTRLLQTWISSARPGEGINRADGLSRWAEELLGKGLPPRPGSGPRWKNLAGVPHDGPQPWSHWLAKCPFFENLPVEMINCLVDEDDAWTSVNLHGETAYELLERKVQQAGGQSRERGLKKFQSWLSEKKMDRQLPPADEDRPGKPALRARL